MKNAFLIICGVLSGIILFQYLFNSCEGKKKDKQIAFLHQQVKDCLNAPIEIDTIETTRILKDTIFLTYRYKITDTVHESEAINWIDQTVEQRDYSGTYEDPQFNVHWSAKITGTLDEISINPPSLVKGLEITKTKTVDLTQYEPPKSTIKEKSHLYTSLGVSTDFKAVNALDANLIYIHRRGIGIMAGMQTTFDRVNFRTGIILKLK
jgi:hypothetical protein